MPMKKYLHLGFTLTELLIAVLIIGIATTIGVNGYQRTWERERVLAVSNELLGWLESVRRSAIGGTSCTATISTGTKSVGATIASVANGATGLCTSIQPLTLTGLTQGYSINVASSASQIIFTSRGTVSSDSGTGDRSITLSLNPGGYSRCIAINSLLGNMAIGVSSGTTCDIQRGG